MSTSELDPRNGDGGSTEHSTAEEGSGVVSMDDIINEIPGVDDEPLPEPDDSMSESKKSS
ncbi:hypothetical protein BHE90_017394, partial [Fusarium euwallaceae]